jgi:hypothetical protein
MRIIQIFCTTVLVLVSSARSEETLKQKDATRIHNVLCLALPVWIVM